jgi:hypothetical protein
MANVKWASGTSGDFATGSNWRGGIAPGPADNATVDARSHDEPYVVSVGQDTQVRNLTIGAEGRALPIELDIDSSTFSANSVVNNSFIVLSNASFVATGAILNSQYVETDANISGYALIEAKKLVNNGVIDADNRNVLTIDAPISGDGVLDIDSGTIVCTSVVKQLISFDESYGYLATLTLADSENSSITVYNLAAVGQTSLDLEDIGFMASDEATFSGTKYHGVLTVTDGTHTARIKLEGNYLSAMFTASSDGHGGTIVVAHWDENVSPPHAMISAMASFGASGAHSNHVSEAWSPREALIASPRVALA